MKNKKSFTIARSFFLTLLIPILILFLILGGGIALSSVYIKTKLVVLLIITIAYIVLLSALYIVAMMYAMKNLRSIYVDGLYGITRDALNDINNGRITKVRYPKKANIEEFNQLNDTLESINSTFENALLITYDLTRANIPLEHIDGNEHLVTLESFKKNLDNLIHSSQNFRNVLLEVSYDFENNSLTKEERNLVIAVLTDAFKDFSYFLIVPNEDGSGYYTFLPYINSFSRIKELCEGMMRKLSVAKKTYDGLVTVSARFSIVCYPYSDVSELFSDLRYARRQGQLINFYFPERLSTLSDNRITQNSVNLNNMTKILNSLSELKVSSKERVNSLEIIKRNIAQIINYLNIDEAGIIYRNPDTSRTNVIVHATTCDEPIFSDGADINNEFLVFCDENKDPDGSYYFSSRAHSNINLTRSLDRYGISSGFYYVFNENDKPRALIFFFNKKKPLIMDSYIRESLFIFSYRISDYLLMNENETKYSDAYREINSILMLSDYCLYRVDPSNHILMAHSQHLPVIFPNAKVGEPCYKCLYGLDAPCKQCPLKTSRKMITEIAKNKYETSLSLNDRSTKIKRMLVHKLQSKNPYNDRFDTDLLINSYVSLNISLNNAYSVHSRGYLLVLRIDNLDKLVSDLGSEGYLFALRQFINNVREITKYGANIFYHDPQSIAILMNEAGQVDVVNLCEQIYEVSKQTYSFEGIYCSFDITYLPYNYPQAYAEVEDFLKYVYRHYINRNYKVNNNFICFPDGEYQRSASRKDFMLAVIDEQFGANTFKVVLQPMVRAGNGAIYGAELFIRLSDEYRATTFNTDELIRVAAKNGKISLISNALIKYIGELYKEFGLTIFKIFGFTRLTINTDFSYFSDPNFFDNIYELLTRYRFPKGFLGFEINESEIMNNRDRFEAISRRLAGNDVALICDQYTGASLSIEALKKLGFGEIKIPRNFVGDIEVNPKHLNEITSIMNLAKQNDMKVTLVGVENSNQYVILRDLDKNCGLQGFHFYRPLDRNAFIDVLRDNNNTK